MTDNLFDKKKIIEKLRAQGIPDKDIEKLYGPIPGAIKPQVNSEKANAFRKKQAWKYDNKHKRPPLQEDVDPDYEPIEELKHKQKKPKRPSGPRISKKKPKPKNDWNPAAETRLKSLYKSGYNSTKLAKEFKTTPDAITGKISRLKKAGWKPKIGTTHAPLPTPPGAPQVPPQSGNAATAAPVLPKKQLSPGTKKFLADALETNFGVAGKYFAKKWGLYEAKTGKGKSGGSAVADAVIKSNQQVVSSLTRLDATLKKGTSSLTKSMSLTTSKVTDAVNSVVDLIKKNQTEEMLSNGGQSSGAVPTGKPGGGSGTIGVIAALLGGAALTSILGSRAEASINPTEQLGVDEIAPAPETQPETPQPQTPDPQVSENNLREKGKPDGGDETPEIEIKVKELTFTADDIKFEADEFKFVNKNGETSNTPNNSNGGSDGSPVDSAPTTGAPGAGNENGAGGEPGGKGGGSGGPAGGGSGRAPDEQPPAGGPTGSPFPRPDAVQRGVDGLGGNDPTTAPASSLPDDGSFASRWSGLPGGGGDQKPDDGSFASRWSGLPDGGKTPDDGSFASRWSGLNDGGSNTKGGPSSNWNGGGPLSVNPSAPDWLKTGAYKTSGVNPTNSGTTPTPNTNSTLAGQRAAYGQQMKDNPQLEEKAMALMMAEESGDSKARKMLLESAMNRGVVHKNESLDSVMNSRYYEPMQHGGGAYNSALNKVQRDPKLKEQLRSEMQEVLAGSNHSNYATDNASRDVKRRAKQTQTMTAYGDNGEGFSRKDRSEWSSLHGAGVTRATQKWLENTKKAEQDASKEGNRSSITNVTPTNEWKSQEPFGAKSGGEFRTFNPSELNWPEKSDAEPVSTENNTGKQLNETQKQNDDANIDASKPKPAPDSQKSSDADNGNDSFKVGLLETQGPNHFADYPMSNEGVGA